MSDERLKHLANIHVSNVDKKSADGDLPVRLCNYTDVYYHDRITGSLDFMEATATSSQLTTFGLRRGDVVLTKDSETPDDIGVSAFVAEDVPNLVCGYHLAVVRAHSDRAVGGYLRWALTSTAVRQRMSAVATGVTRFGLRSDAIGDLLIPVHSLAVQGMVANYLDTHTARIDALITKKQRMVELLAERVKSCLANTLLHLDAPTALLGQTARIHSGAGFPHAYQGQEAGDLPFYKVADLAGSTDGRFISHATNWIDRSAARELGCRPAPPGAVLFPKVGAALLGNQRRITTVTAAFDNNLMAVTPSAHDPRFLRYWLSLVDLGEMANPGPVPSINEDVVASLRVPVPPLAEQVTVADALDSKTDEVNRAIATLRRQLELTSEHRQALITAGVTGELSAAEAA